MNNLFKKFIHFSNTFYSMFDIKSKVKDDRKSPQISADVIFLNLLALVLFKKRSFLQLDQFMRINQAKRFVGRKDKPVAVSDSTISRSLSTYHLEPLRCYIKSIYIRACHYGKCILDIFGKRLRLACVDGSLFGKFYGCVFQILGKADLILDIEETASKGKEIPTTKTLLRRVFSSYGKGFVDMILFDGLYADKHTINYVLSQDVDVLIKTEETSLMIIQDAESLFRGYKDHDYVNYISGIDINRLCSYEMWYCDSFEFS